MAIPESLFQVGEEIQRVQNECAQRKRGSGASKGGCPNPGIKERQKKAFFIIYENVKVKLPISKESKLK